MARAQGRNMATESAHSNSTQAGEPRRARLAILAAARRVHQRDGAGAVSVAGVAKEAGTAPEIVATHFQDAQEILLALAADDLSSLARAMHDEGREAPARAESPVPQPASLRKKPVLSTPLEQVMKDIAPDQGKEVITGAMARVERRIQVLEKAFAEITEKQEKSARDTGGSLAAVEENIGAIHSRMDSAEQHNIEVIGNFRSALSTVAVRLDALEKSNMGAAIPGNGDMTGPEPMTTSATPKPASARPEYSDMPGMAEGGATSTYRDHAASLSMKSPIDEPPLERAGGERTAMPDTGENYLTAARRSALAAAGSKSEMKNANRQEHARRGSLTKYLIFACLAPVAILGTAFVVLNRNTVTAKLVEVTPPGVLASVAAQIGIAPPATTAIEAAAPPAPPAVPVPSKRGSAASFASLIQAAEAGDVQSMRDAGLRFLSGEGTNVDEALAAGWLLRAAYKGDAVAEYWLATLYARGRGVPQDAFQANHWYEAAAKQGNRRAMHSLAVANFQGLGMEKNLEEAARWFKASSELGLVDSQFNLAVLYERGSGVPQSLTEAYKWYAVAASQGDKEADSRLAILVSQMQPADLALAQSEASAFKPKPMDKTVNLATGSSKTPGG